MDSGGQKPASIATSDVIANATGGRVIHVDEFVEIQNQARMRLDPLERLLKGLTSGEETVRGKAVSVRVNEIEHHMPGRNHETRFTISIKQHSGQLQYTIEARMEKGQNAKVLSVTIYMPNGDRSKPLTIFSTLEGRDMVDIDTLNMFCETVKEYEEVKANKQVVQHARIVEIGHPISAQVRAARGGRLEGDD